MALALVADGLERLKRGERDAAEELFNRALGLDPHLADAYVGLAQTQLRRGPLGILPAVRYSVAALTARLGTARGGYHLRRLVIPAALVALLAVAAAASLGLLINYGPLLLHDLDEEFGPSRGPMFARGLFAAAAAAARRPAPGLGVAAALVARARVRLPRCRRSRRCSAAAAGRDRGPGGRRLSPARMESEANPVFSAALTAVEGGPDARATARLETARSTAAGDHDLTYLLARQYRKEAGPRRRRLSIERR